MSKSCLLHTKQNAKFAHLGLAQDFADLPKEMGRLVGLTPVEQGLDGQNYLLETTTSRYFVKYFGSDFKAKVNRLAAVAESFSLTPDLVWQNKKAGFVAFEYIDGKSLNQIEISQKEIVVALSTVLAHTHQLSKVDVFKAIDFYQVVTELESDLLLEQAFKLLDIEAFEQLRVNFHGTVLKKLELLLLRAANSYVVCHGDVNQTNILVTSSSECNGISYRLVDFDSVCLAPREYDLGMAIAINKLSKRESNELIEQYLKAHSKLGLTKLAMKAFNINIELVNIFACYSAYINFIWCMSERIKLDASRQQARKKYAGLTLLAKTQFTQLVEAKLVEKEQFKLLMPC